MMFNAHPLELETLAAYRLGELSAEEEARVESHYFECATCAARLRFVESLSRDVAKAVSDGRISAGIAPDFVERAAKQGVTLRRYDIEVGASIQCTAAPEDDLIVVRLAVPLPPGTAVDIETEFQDLANGSVTHHVASDVLVSAEARSILYAFSAESVRAYPKSRFVLHVRPRGSDAVFGPFTMNHTPWNELPRET